MIFIHILYGFPYLIVLELLPKLSCLWLSRDPAPACCCLEANLAKEYLTLSYPKHFSLILHISIMGLIPATGDSLGITPLVTDSIFLALAAVAVILRVWSRRIMQTSLCFNDYAVIVAWVRESPFRMNGRIG